MGKVKLNDGRIIDDRRTNGNSRIKLDAGDWLKIISTVVVIIWCLAGVNSRVNTHSEVLAQLSDIAEENRILSRDNRKDIEFLKTLFEQINTKLDKIIRIR